ncbi:MAG: phosphotransferase [Terracidiphilus sp.]
MVILVGNPSANRKLVTFLLDEARQIAAVLKIGLSAGGGACVLREADVLGKLEQYSWAPKILSVHSEKWAAAQEYVHGSMPDREFRPGYMELLCNLPRSGGCKTLSAVAAEMFGRLSPLKDELDKMVPGLLDRALDRLDFDHSVPTMLVHGDFSPWNIRRNPKVGDVLVDWERADFAGLPAYDLLHFQFNDDLLFGEKAGGYSAIRSRPICAEYFRRMDLDAELLPRVAIAYLLDQLASDCQPEHAAYLLRQLAVILD